jgi:hypothetical protein
VGSHVNRGTLTLRAPEEAAPGDAVEAMTVIVTGVGRSGTSMAAKVLEALGVPMGNTGELPVHEDQDFLRALLYFDFSLLAGLIGARNKAFARWGFKFPSLQNHLMPPQLGQFRNPHLIVIMRDPVAIASRSLDSDPEKRSVNETLRNVTRQIGDLMNMVERAECPVLLLSYEKFVAFPETGIEEMAAFCRLQPDGVQMARARAAVAPNNPHYIELFHRQHRGHFDGVVDGYAVGWCAVAEGGEAVAVEVLADGAVVASGMASLFRKDLAVAGIGYGKHAFRINLAGLRFGAETMLAVRPVGVALALDGSHRRLAALAAV